MPLSLSMVSTIDAVQLILSTVHWSGENSALCVKLRHQFPRGRLGATIEKLPPIKLTKKIIHIIKKAGEAKKLN